MTSGFLYVADCKDGTGRLKIGQSTDLHSRKYGWPGATSIEFELLHVVPAKLPYEAETYAHGLLDSQGCRPVGSRKELFHATLEQAKEACAIAAAHVESLPPKASRHPSLETPIVPLTSADPAIAALLLCDVRYQGVSIPLGALMALSITHRSASARLTKLGVECVYRRHANPEFWIYPEESPVLSEWAAACGISCPPGGHLDAACYPASLPPVTLH